jgi:RNAse (barnase) inhibitor barstar
MESSHPSNGELLDWLLSTDPPWAVECDSSEIIATLKSAWLEVPTRRWYSLDGAAMDDWAAAYTHMSAVFGFPDYFGRNLAALDECLADSDVLVGSGFVVEIENSSLAFRNAGPESFQALLETLESAAEEWSMPVAVGEPWDRAAMPFHVLVNAKPA